MKTLDQNEIIRRMKNAIGNVMFYTTELNRLPLAGHNQATRALAHREHCLNGMRHAVHAEAFAIVLGFENTSIFREIHAGSVALENMATAKTENPRLYESIELRMQHALQMLVEIEGSGPGNQNHHPDAEQNWPHSAWRGE